MGEVCDSAVGLSLGGEKEIRALPSGTLLCPLNFVRKALLKLLSVSSNHTSFVW